MFLVGLHWQTRPWRGKGIRGGWLWGGVRGGLLVGPVGHAGGSFVYTAISSGLLSENTCTDHRQMGQWFRELKYVLAIKQN